MAAQPKQTFWNFLKTNFEYSKFVFRKDFWRNLFKKPQDELTVVLLSKGHLEVRKLRFSVRLLWGLKVFGAAVAVCFIFSFLFLVQDLVQLPQRTILKDENIALRKELNRIQFHLDTLQSSMDRMNRFDQKLRALTDIDKDFAKMKGPMGQGGGESEDPSQQTYDFGDFKIDASNLEIDSEATKYLDRRQTFLVQKIYSWMNNLYKGSELQEQSYEELFEVLKGREIQLSATPSIIPVKGWVTSHFGYRLDPFTSRRALHRGMDVAAKEGAPVYAPADGVVTFTGQNGGFGDTVMLFHGYGISTLYAHLEEALVRSGQKVKRGEIIARVGSSGRSTGAHLHYEVVVHGVPVDPRKYVLDRSL